MTCDRKILESILGNEDCDGLDLFFERVLSAPHDFKVAMAGRCFHLFYAFKGDGDAKDRCEVISDNALLLYADDFAEHLMAHGDFPSVLLFDDIMLYGWDFYSILYRMEELVFNAVKRRGQSGITRRKVHEKMFASVDIRVYALGNIDDAIDSLYLYKINCITHRYGSDMLQLSKHISESLSACGNMNAYFLAFFEVNGQPTMLDSFSLSQASWDYDDSHGVVLADGHGRHMRMTHWLTQGADDGEHAWVTGIPCVESVAGETLDGICMDLAKWIENHEDSGWHARRLARLLRTDGNGYVRYKMLLVALIASAEAVRHFLVDDKDWMEFLKQSNINHVCRHFGRGTDVLDPLMTLLCDTDKLYEWTQTLYDGSTRIEPVGNCEGESDGSLLIRGENLVCEVGLRAEQDAYDFGHRRRTFELCSDSDRMIVLGRFLDGMRGKDGRIPLDAIACLMSMQHRGIATIGYGVDGKGERVVCRLEAGTLAIQTFPQRHRYVLPALAYIERATRTFPKAPEEMLCEFVQELPDDFLDGVPMLPVISDLKANFPKYVEVAFYTKKGISRWSEVNWSNSIYTEENLTTDEWEKLKKVFLTYAMDYVMHQRESL